MNENDEKSLPMGQEKRSRQNTLNNIFMSSLAVEQLDRAHDNNLPGQIEVDVNEQQSFRIDGIDAAGEAQNDN